MARIIDRSRDDASQDGLEIAAYRMYPESAGIIKLRRPGRDRPIVNIHLTAAEADLLSKALARKD